MILVVVVRKSEVVVVILVVVIVSGVVVEKVSKEVVMTMGKVDQFINDKSTEDELEKLNVEAEVVSMVTVLIYQASSSVPPLSTPNLGSRVYTLELRDLPHKIDEAVCENVKEAIQIALPALLKEHFRDLFEEDMK
ncbi:hypothetical protein Tco_0371374 [Tanacetum coccineum]